MKSGSSLPRTTTPLLWLRKGLCSCVVGGRVLHSLTGYSVCFGSCWGGAHQFCFSMDNILRNLESLSRTELVWLNTYLVGRLRALPPENDSHPAVPGIESPGSVAMQGPHGVTCQQEAAVAPLPDRIDALNSSLDPWERTGAAPQGWATHLHQAMVPIQGYIQLRPQTEGTLPAFGFASQSPSGDKAGSDSGGQPAPRRIGKASPSVSIFSRDPICKNTCRYCRCQPCDVGVEHDDHTCYSCEQRLLHPEGVPGAPWRPPLTHNKKKPKIIHPKGPVVLQPAKTHNNCRGRQICKRKASVHNSQQKNNKTFTFSRPFLFHFHRRPHLLPSRRCCSESATVNECRTVPTSLRLFSDWSCLGKVPGGAPFSQRSERATACTIRMQIVKQINKKRIKQGKQQIKVTKFQIKMQRSAVRPRVLTN